MVQSISWALMKNMFRMRTFWKEQPRNVALPGRTPFNILPSKVQPTYSLGIRPPPRPVPVMVVPVKSQPDRRLPFATDRLQKLLPEKLMPVSCTPCRSNLPSGGRFDRALISYAHHRLGTLSAGYTA